MSKSAQNHITKTNQNHCSSIKINPNHTYMHDNLQRKRKSKGNSLLHILATYIARTCMTILFIFLVFSFCSFYSLYPFGSQYYKIQPHSFTIPCKSYNINEKQ